MPTYRRQISQALARVNAALKVYRFNTTAELISAHTQQALVAAFATAGLSILAFAMAGLGIFAITRPQLQLRQYVRACRNHWVHGHNVCYN